MLACFELVEKLRAGPFGALDACSGRALLFSTLLALPTTHFTDQKQAPKATICIVGGTNVAHALAWSPHVSASFTIETPFGVSPVVYFGETDGVPFYHITLHGSPELSGVAEQDVLLRVWSALHQLEVSDVLGGATAGSINEKYKLGDWGIVDAFF